MLSITDKKTSEYMELYGLRATFAADPADADFLKLHETLADGLADHEITDPVAWRLGPPSGTGINGTSRAMLGEPVEPPADAASVESRGTYGPGWGMELSPSGDWVRCDVPPIRGPLLFADWGGHRWVIFDRATAPAPRPLSITRGRWD